MQGHHILYNASVLKARNSSLKKGKGKKEFVLYCTLAMWSPGITWKYFDLKVGLAWSFFPDNLLVP